LLFAAKTGWFAGTPMFSLRRMMTETIRYWKGYLWAGLAAPSQAKLFKDVETYCMFIGHPRSGHSLHGALLNAHPEMVISHELDALLFVKNGVNRNQLYSLILKRDRWFGQKGRQWGDFKYEVPNQFVGRFQKLKVIGDKKGGRSSFHLGTQPELLDKLRRIAGVPVKIFHVVRNPYDNISTMARHNGRPLADNIKAYFRIASTDSGVIERTNPSDILTVRHEDFIANSAEYLKRYLKFLGLTADENYFTDSDTIVAKSPSKSRLKAPWDDRLKADVQSRLEKFPFLRGYTFEA
jgi:hypothetical protein